jgi:hypothetical protein
MRDYNVCKKQSYSNEVERSFTQSDIFAEIRSEALRSPARGCDQLPLNGPFEGPGILVVPVDERTDIGFELADGGMNTAPEPLSGEFSEPALDLIDP